MNGAAKVIMGVLALYAAIFAVLFGLVTSKADRSAVMSLSQDVREIRSDVKDLLRAIGGGR